ncbi:Zinc phosphodiesterase ELAC protein 1 [Leucoagaricus sp. SymC.cos]|nr:Zinc phosphodiesterase ELAC protein 1 [Leucoagaricus sp. SymC.cos]
MAGDGKTPRNSTSDDLVTPPPSPPPQVAQPSSPDPPSSASADDRSLLLSRARSFLQSPQVSGQDLLAKRQFLREKGIYEAEIDTLLRDVMRIEPYPSRFLLPRISQSYMARHSLKNHHLSLIRRLTASLSSFKEYQAETWSILPKADPWRELPPYSKCSCLDDITGCFGDGEEPQFDLVSPVTMLRCGLTDLTKEQEDDQKPTTEELFRYLEEKIPWLLSADGLKHEVRSQTFLMLQSRSLPCKERLWEVLSSCSFFTVSPSLSPPGAGQDPQPPSRWSYMPSLPPDPSPVVKSLSSLKFALPKNQMTKPSALVNALQTLSEFVGYISSQVYMPYRSPTSGVGIASNLGPIEEQLRREIRALKGLVLNRCLNGAGGTTEGTEDPRTQTMSTNQPPIEVYGPLGTRAYIRNALSYTHTNLDGTYVVHELRFPSDPQNDDYTALSPPPSEVQGRNIPQVDGFWKDIYSSAVVSVSAAPIHHSVPCVGYVINEAPIPGKIDPKKYIPDIKRTNTPMSVMRQLQQGQSIQLSDGTILHGPRRRTGRKLVILGDTYDPSPIYPLACDADLLIHEATNAHLPGIDPNTKPTDTEESVEERAKSRGHSTP